MSKIKELIAMIGLKKMILACFMLAPVIGIAVSPEFAENFATHLAGLLQMILDALPEEAVDAASAVPAE